MEAYASTRNRGAVFSHVWDTRDAPDHCLTDLAGRPRVEFHMRRLKEPDARRLGSYYFEHYIRLSAWIDESRSASEAEIDKVLSAIEPSLNAFWGTSKKPGPMRDRFNMQWLDRRIMNGRVFWGWATLPTDKRLGFDYAQ